MGWARAWPERGYRGMFAHLLEGRAEVFGWGAWLHTCMHERGTCSGEEEASASVCMPARGSTTARDQWRTGTLSAPLLVAALHMHLVAALKWPGAASCSPVLCPVQSVSWQQKAAIAMHLRRRATGTGLPAGRLAAVQTAAVVAATPASARTARWFRLPF